MKEKSYDPKVLENNALNSLMKESENLRKQLSKKQKRRLWFKVVANSICFLFLMLMVCVLSFSLNEKPVLKAQGIVSEVVMKDHKVTCIIEGQDYELSKGFILGIDVPTSPRSGDEVAIYEVCSKTFAVSPLLEYEKIVDATMIHSEMYAGILFFSIFALVFAFFVSVNIRSLRYLKYLNS